MNPKQAKEIVDSVPVGFSGFKEEFPDGYDEAKGFLEGVAYCEKEMEELLAALRHIKTMDCLGCGKCAARVLKAHQKWKEGKP